MHFNRIVAATAAITMTLTACAGGGDTSDGSDGSDDGGSASSEPVTLRFQSLAWQEESVAANQDIVAAWNDQNPDIQVEYIQGDWGSAHDQLLTSFEGGSPPDVFHYEAAASQVFAEGGFLADLEPLLSDGFKASIDDESWATVQYEEHGTTGVPFLFESRMALANKTLLDAAGIEVPTPDDPWTWDEFREVARELTTDETYGLAWPLGSPANAMLSLSQGFGGDFVSDPQGDPAIVIGDAELEVPRRVHQMIFEDGSVDPGSITSSTSDSLPGFFADQYAMVFGAIWLRQQLEQQAPDDFEWVTIPPLQGTAGIRQAANPQVLSVAMQSEHAEEAAQFIEFFLNDENMAELAKGDWLVPTSEGALEVLDADTGGEQGWDVAVASVDALATAPWQRVAGFQEWLDRVATPAFQRYFADEITTEELEEELEDSSVRLGS